MGHQAAGRLHGEKDDQLLDCYVLPDAWAQFVAQGSGFLSVREGAGTTGGEGVTPRPAPETFFEQNSVRTDVSDRRTVAKLGSDTGTGKKKR